MKKFALAAVAAAALTAGGVAQAYTIGTFSNGVVVPNVIHNGDGDVTAVGLINQQGGPICVTWTFFDQDSNHVTDGRFAMTNKQYRPFIWNPATAGFGLAGQRGYLVFAATTATTGSGACSNGSITTGSLASGAISANAFQVNATAQTVAFTPVIDGDLTIVGGTDLTNMGPTSLTNVAGAHTITATSVFNLRYALSSSWNSTRIAVWSTGNQSGSYTVNIFDDQQTPKSVNFLLDHAELAWFDPSTINGRPASFTDGFIEWRPGTVAPTNPVVQNGDSTLTIGGSAFAYSVISSNSFNSTQSVLGSVK